MLKIWGRPWFSESSASFYRTLIFLWPLMSSSIPSTLFNSLSLQSMMLYLYYGYLHDSVRLFLTCCPSFCICQTQAVVEVLLEKPVDLLQRSTSLGSDFLVSEIRHGPIYQPSVFCCAALFRTLFMKLYLGNSPRMLLESINEQFSFSLDE